MFDVFRLLDQWIQVSACLNIQGLEIDQSLDIMTVV